MFSVVIPCFNNEQTLSRAVASAAAQQHCGEVIVVDDGSTVDLSPIISECQHQFSCPIVYIKQANQGPAAARNAGLLLAKKEWVIFCDADDALTPHALTTLHAAIQTNPDAQWILGGYRAIHADRQKEYLPAALPQTAFERLSAFLWHRLKISQGTIAIQTDVAQAIQFPEALRHGEDIVFYSQLVTQYAGTTVPAILVDIYHAPTSLRHQSESILLEDALLPQALFNTLPASFQTLQPDYTAKHFMSLTKVALRAEQKTTARHLFKRAIATKPSQLLSPSIWKIGLKLL